MAAANTVKPAPKNRRKSRWSDLFFFRRRPHMRGIPPDWEQPDDDVYQKLIQDDGFVSIKLWKEGDIASHPIIVRDLKDLEQYLLPTYFQFSQKSKYFQNQFYLYQWVFVWGAFFTTVFGTLSTLYSLPGGDASTQALNGVSGVTVHQLFSVMTAIIGAATAFFTSLSNRGEPQKRWGKTRRLSEELRMHYFNYLSHLAPYDQPNRVQKLRENVINIRVKEQENV